MARHGVTYQDVANAANQLMGQGKQPTIETIRHILGTGSSTTLANHLRKWRADQDGSAGIASKENLPQELIAVMKGLWERVISQSQNQIAILQENYQNTIADLEQDLQKYKTNNTRWQQLFNQWQQEKNQLSSDKLSLEQALQASQQNCSALSAKQDGLVQQLQEKQERIEELHRLHKQSQTNLEHYREAAREQRMLDQEQFDQQKLQLNLEVKTLSEQIALQREKMATLQQQNDALQQAHQALENNYSQSFSQIEKLKAALEDSEKSKIEYYQANQYLQNQLNNLQNTLDNKISEFISIQTESKLLSQQIQDVKQLLREAQDQSKLLANEKWELAQEKSQLEGQLKQLHKMVHA